MARALRYHPLFDCDVREAAGWYDRRSTGLGDVFVDLVSQSVAEIIVAPERFAVGPTILTLRSYSSFSVRGLLDLVDEELQIFGVLHTARSMEKWRERQGEM